MGKGITVKSASGPAVTIIDGSTTGNYAVTFSTNETTKSVISGFMLLNGTPVYIQNASPTVKGNVIAGSNFGSDIYLSNGGGVIQGNLIANGPYAGINANSDTGLKVVGNIIADSFGMGLQLSTSAGSDLIQQNTITGNYYGGINSYFSSISTTTLLQNLIVGNRGPGVSWTNSSAVTLVSNTIAANQVSCCGNTASEVDAYPIDGATLQNNLVVADGIWPAVDCTSSSGVKLSANNDVFSASTPTYTSQCPDPTGTNGNLSVDPVFADQLSDNYHLQSSSPVIGVGTTSAAGEPKIDFDGDPRLTGTNIDIGADEYSAVPAQTLSSSSLHYGTEDVGSTSAAQTVTLTNNKKSAIAISLIATGPSFSQTNNCGTSLGAGASCQISVVFSPITGGTINGVLGIFTSATLNPEAITLLGTGVAPQLQIGCCFSFYNQTIGTTSSQSVSVSNTGQAPLLIDSISYTGTTDFVESTDCPIAPNTLAAGASCNLTLSFTPTILGSEAGTIFVTSNAGNAQLLYVSGSSVSAGNPVITPSSLTFPTTLIGQSSASQNLTMTNTGTGALGITQISSGVDFQWTNNCPSSLAVNASCTITVTYTPSVQGSATDNLYVYTDSAYSASATLNGTGTAPIPTISSFSQTSAASGSGDTQIVVVGTGFVPYSSQVFWNGSALTDCCVLYNGTTQLIFTIPAANLATAGTNQISISTPAPGGGTSNSVPFTVYTPVNYAFKPTAYNYRNITGTNLNLYYYSGVQLTSPFPIQFGGGSYSNLTVGGGGTISFNNFYYPYNDVIPTSQTPMLIAPLWDPLNPFGTTNNNVFWQVLGSAPNRELVIEWRNVGICCETTNTVKFEVVFFEGNSNILFNYADTVFGGSYSSYDNGAIGTVGVQVAPTIANQFSYNTASLTSKSALLWYPSNPTATLSTSSISFGYHQIGTSSLPQPLTLTNGGLVPLAISSLAIDNPDFTQTNNCGSSVAPHKSCSIHVVFKPTQPSTETATLTVTDSASNSPQTVSLTGIGSITSVVVYPILVNFGGVTVGSTGTAPVTLANASNQTMTIQQISVAPGVYAQINNCGTSLAPGLSCTVNVTFTPTQKGSVQGTLSMGLNGKAVKVVSNLTGAGN